MSFIVSLLIGKWAKFFWPAVAIVIVFFYWDGRNKEIAELRTSLAATKAELVIEQTAHKANVAKLKVEIASQNDTIEQWHVHYKEQVYGLKVKIATLEATHASTNTALNDALDRLANVPKMETCEAAIGFIVDTAIQNPWPKENK